MQHEEMQCAVALQGKNIGLGCIRCVYIYFLDEKRTYSNHEARGFSEMNPRIKPMLAVFLILAARQTERLRS